MVPACSHSTLIVESSSHAIAAGYTQPPKYTRLVATGQGKRAVIDDSVLYADSATFPAPLILPGDDLAMDPKHPAQSLTSWQRLRERNQVTARRRTLYVAVPECRDPRFNEWAKPCLPAVKGKAKKARAEEISGPRTEDVIAYLRAFYHGMPVEEVPFKVDIRNWDDDGDDDDDVENPKPKPTSKGKSRTTLNHKRQKKRKLDSDHGFVGLAANNGMTRIRTRPSPDGLYRRQLNQLDLLDACIDMLPATAYALVLIVPFDLHESDDDEFCCGLAFGGSRVAVVSSARYHPLLDELQGVERVHAWPASHCREYVEGYLAENEEESEGREKEKGSGRRQKMARTNTAGASHGFKGSGNNASNPITLDSSPASAISKAKSKIVNIPSSSLTAPENSSLSPLQAATDTVSPKGPPRKTNISPTGVSTLWLSRLCRTASHELGHCLGIGHCIYYACAMQGSATICEDARQPPYLCPVCEAKVLSATADAERLGVSQRGGRLGTENAGIEGARVGVAEKRRRVVERAAAMAEVCRALGDEKGGCVFGALKAWCEGRIGRIREFDGRESEDVDMVI
jgi:archaemetzincin